MRLMCTKMNILLRKLKMDLEKNMNDNHQEQNSKDKTKPAKKGIKYDDNPSSEMLVPTLEIKEKTIFICIMA